MEDEDPDSDDFFFTSTLLIIDPVNGSELICSGTAASVELFFKGTLLLYGVVSMSMRSSNIRLLSSDE